MELKDLKQDKRNYRRHNDKNISLIRKSVDEAGLGRSIVIDNQNEIIAGNGLVSAISKNTPIKIVETDGSELVVVKRTDLSTDDEKRKKLAVMDNSTTDNSEFDMGDVVRISKGTTKQDELFDYVDAPYYLKERVKDYDEDEYYKDDFDISR